MSVSRIPRVRAGVAADAGPVERSRRVDTMDGMSAVSVSDARWLTSPAGREAVAALPPYRESQALALAERLRAQGIEPGHVAAALTQARLRARALGKLGKVGEGAASLLLTPDGLEQATRPRIAALHSRRFVDAGVGTVWDLGCGLGLDALAFARAGLAVRAVEADEATAVLAAANLAGHPDVQVRCSRAQDVPELLDTEGVGVWFDPARRTPGRTDSQGRTRRTFGLDQLSPGWEFVQQVAESVGAVGAKLSPAFPHGRLPHGAQAQWISHDGEVLECALWWGPLATTPGRTALVLRGDSAWEVVPPDAPVRPAASLAAEPGRWLYDPDRAVVRAGLVDTLAAVTDGAQVGPDAGYVVSDRGVDVPWARRHVIAQVLPAAPKSVRAALRAQGIDRVTIKKRGTPVDPDVFRAKLRLPAKGEGREGVLVLTSTPRGPVTLLVEKG